MTPRAIEKATWLAAMIAGNRRESVTGIKALLLGEVGRDLAEEWDGRTRLHDPGGPGGPGRGGAFGEFIAPTGRPR